MRFSIVMRQYLLIYIKRDRAVWSARQAHALKVVGSNPAPAIQDKIYYVIFKENRCLLVHLWYSFHNLFIGALGSYM